MKIIPVPHDLDDKLLAQPDYVRGKGLHMSDLYNGLYQELEPKRYKKGEPIDPLRVGAGLAFESILEEGLKRRLIERPGEFVEPEYGIIFSPDLVIFNHHLRVGEIKLTWLSTREVPREPANAFPPKFAKYVTQMACYCHCLETPYARLIGFFVNGDYRKMAPELLAWDIEFSKREMHEEWMSCVNYGKQRGLIHG